jgi:hypothetical protein
MTVGSPGQVIERPCLHRRPAILTIVGRDMFITLVSET